MTKFERWFIKRVTAREVRQGPTHTLRITDLYFLIGDAVREEFTEDNKPTREAFLRKCFDRSLTLLRP